MTHWSDTLNLIRAGEQLQTSSDDLSPVHRAQPENEAHSDVQRGESSQGPTVGGEGAGEAQSNGAEDDLDVDLAKAALKTGAAAFEAGEWEEADALLQEALQVVQQLPRNQRGFCDLSALEHRLAICSYHTQEPASSEWALLSFVQRPASSSEHRKYVCDAAHHLALLYVRMGRIDDAKIECEKALQGRRQLLGKHSEPALQSTALAAHIYGLGGNRARAKACREIIPEVRRADVVSTIEASLGMKWERSECSSVSTESISEMFFAQGQSTSGDRYRVDRALQMDDRCYGPVSLDISASPFTSPRPSYQRDFSGGSEFERMSPLTTVRSESLPERRRVSSPVPKDTAYKYYSPNLEAHQIASVRTSESPYAKTATTTTTVRSIGLSRTDILRNIRCVPSDRFEEAVCTGDIANLTSLLGKKRSGSWRSKMQKALHSKRVSALHFAALFGEVEMARALLSAGYDIQEVPELSATRQTPLKFAIGARQVDMVIFLTARGARPIEPDSWATLAGLLMDKSWLSNTLSVADREDLEQVPGQIIAILRAWLKKGWDPSSPYNASGRTLLHQAVAFESGFYKWDANLRGAMTRFLCNEGADPTRLDSKGNSPYDMATVVEDQDVLLVFDQLLKMKGLGDRLDGRFELDSGTPSSVELSAKRLDRVELPG